MDYKDDTCNKICTSLCVEVFDDKTIVFLRITLGEDIDEDQMYEATNLGWKYIDQHRWNFKEAQHVFGKGIVKKLAKSTEIIDGNCPHNTHPDRDYGRLPQGWMDITGAKLHVTLYVKVFDDQSIVEMNVTVGEDILPSSDQAKPEYWRKIDSKRWTLKDANGIFGKGVVAKLAKSIEMMEMDCPYNL